jgi:putative hydrolase of the HAD superfamily
MKYRHLFFDLDHTLWDYDANAKLSLTELYHDMALEKAGVHDVELFYTSYLRHNEYLWDKYRKGLMKADELRWKRMWLTLMEFKLADEKLAHDLGHRFMEMLPTRTILFPDTANTLQYLTEKGYTLHLITNGFEQTQHCKLRNSGIAHFFVEVITSEGSNSIKPKKEIFEYALKKAAALNHHSIMIGDSIEVDIMGAMNAGMDQVYVNHVCAACTVKPTYEVNSIRELSAIF